MRECAVKEKEDNRLAEKDLPQIRSQPVETLDDRQIPNMEI